MTRRPEQDEKRTTPFEGARPDFFQRRWVDRAIVHGRRSHNATGRFLLRALKDAQKFHIVDIRFEFLTIIFLKGLAFIS